MTTATISLTDAESHVLKAIAFDEMNTSNGEYPESAADVSTYSDAEQWSPEGWSAKQCRGVMSSLAKKGLIKVFEEKNDRAGKHQYNVLVDFTELGYKTFTEICPE